MWKNPWRLLGLTGLISVSVVLLAGCGSSGSSSSTSTGSDGSGGSEPVKLAFFGFSAENAYTQAILEGVKEGAAKSNAEVQFFDGKFEPTTQSSQIQDATASGQYEGFLITPIDPPSVTPVVTEALEQGVDVGAVQFNIGQELNDELQIPDLTVRATYGYETGAEAIAEEAVGACAGKNPCNVVVLWGERTSPFENARREGMLKVFDQNPNVKVIAEPDAGYLREPAYAAMQDVLQQGKEIDVVMTASGDQMIAGAEEALEQANVPVGLGAGEVKLIGNSAAETAVTGVRNGTWLGSYLEEPVTMGRLAATELVKAIRGEPFEEHIDMDKHHPGCADSQFVDAAFLKQCPKFNGEWDG
jgi:ribose transport system substrate-binding protein